MKRRSFLTLLATLTACIPARLRGHENAVKGSFNTLPLVDPPLTSEGKRLSQLDEAPIIYRLFDGERMVCERPHEACCVVGRRVVFVTKVARNTYVGAPRRSSYQDTVFAPRPMHIGLAYDKAYNLRARYVYCDYESGFKWWEEPTRVRP